MSKKTKFTPPAFPLKAIVICDDLAFASYAASTLERVGRQAGINVQWTTKSWPMNALNESALAEQALAEASDAHLILFPEHHARSLPFWVFGWLDRWAARRSIRDAAVGVIKSENAARFASPLFSELSTFAREHGLSLIVDDDLPTGKRMRVPVRFPTESQIALPIASTALVGMGLGESYRGFGINE